MNETAQAPAGPTLVERLKGRAVPLVIAAGVTILLVLGGAMVWRAEARVNKVSLAASAKPVTVVEAKAATFRPAHVYVGTLQPWVEARVGPQFVSAYVDTVLVRPGAIVKRGEILATLDCRNASAASQAVAMQARAIDARQKALADEAARLQSLLDGGFVSPNEAEQKTAQSAAQAAELLSQKAKLMNAALEVSDCILRAPFDGEVATRTVDPGAFVRPGTHIVSVVDRSIVRMVGDAPEIDFEAVAPRGRRADPRPRHRRRPRGHRRAAGPGRRPGDAHGALRDRHRRPRRTLPVNTTGEITIDVGEPVAATELPLYAASIRARRRSSSSSTATARSRTVRSRARSAGASSSRPL